MKIDLTVSEADNIRSLLDQVFYDPSNVDNAEMTLQVEQLLPELVEVMETDIVANTAILLAIYRNYLRQIWYDGDETSSECFDEECECLDRENCDYEDDVKSSEDALKDFHSWLMANTETDCPCCTATEE
jgi:hypothetical protein